MKTRDLAAVATAILNFQNGRQKTWKIVITLHDNLCIDSFFIVRIT